MCLCLRGAAKNGVVPMRIMHGPWRQVLCMTLLGWLGLLAGCASNDGLHPQGKWVDPSTMAVKNNLHRLGLARGAWPRQDWWRGLGSTQLNALIDEALKKNPDLAIAAARAREVQAQAGVIHAAQLPEITAGGGVGGSRLPLTLKPLGNGAYLSNKYVGASFSWGLDLWGGKKAAWEAALGRARAAEIEQRAARIVVSANVARAYAHLGYAYAQLDIAAAELARTHRVSELTRQRVAAGIDNQLQLKQSDAAAADAQQQLASARRAVATARLSLSMLLGRSPDHGLAIPRPDRLTPAAVAVPDNLPIDLLGHRADLIAARWRVEAAAHDIKAAKTQFLPNINLNAYVGWIALGSADLFQARARFYNVAPSLNLPIFEGGRLRAHLAERDAQYDEAVARYNKVLIHAIHQVVDDLSALKWLHEQVDAQQQALHAAHAAWELAEQRYHAGVGNYLEVLSVRRQLLAAEQDMALLHAQQVDLSVQLIQALGGGLYPHNGDVYTTGKTSQPSSS